MDDIKQRLHDTSEQCYKSYEAWNDNKKDSAARTNLAEAVHELRRVASRLEIEMAKSESSQSGKNKIAIPPHRDSKRKGGGDNKGNRSEGAEKKDKVPEIKRRKPPAKKAAES